MVRYLKRKLIQHRIVKVSPPPPTERQEAWNSLAVFDTAADAASVINSRLKDDNVTSPHVLEKDSALLNYLADEESFLGLTPVGQTEDLKASYTHRRLRITGMLKTLEEKYFESQTGTKTENDWKDFYKKVIGFFDVKLENEFDDSRAKWIQRYSIFYLTAWNYEHIEAFEDPEGLTESGLKFRGLVAAVVETFPRGKKREALYSDLSELDKSTKMRLDDKSLISREFRTCVDNIETYNSLHKQR